MFKGEYSPAHATDVSRSGDPPELVLNLPDYLSLCFLYACMIVCLHVSIL